MAGKAFDKIIDGLTDALAYADGDKSRGKAREVEVPPVDVRVARDEDNAGPSAERR